MSADLDFREAGACRGHDPNIFYPQRGQANTRAMALCAGCPVAEACRDWALHHELMGVWGGTSERERRRLRRTLGIRMETPTAYATVCGTEAGYMAHRRADEAACAPCRAAHVASDRARRDRRNARLAERVS